MIKERRRAIHCDLVEPSKTSPGYFKYLITIREKDGSEHKVPAYGKDMQDAIERLLWTERVEKVNDKTINIIILSLFVFSIGIGGVLSAYYNKPSWLLGSIIISIVFGIIINQVDKYFNKGR
jgi:hypothetical protein